MVALLAGLVGLTSCASPATDAWIITPIRYDNSISGPAQDIDVTYPMPHIARDTAGGFWTESAGSWLHINSEGKVAARFNLDGEMQFLQVRGISAFSPSALVVSGHTDRDVGGALWRFDTADMKWEPIASAADVVGDVEAVGTALFYVGYLYELKSDPSFVVHRVDADGNDTVITPPVPIVDDNDVAISVEPDGSVVANTGARVLKFDPSSGVPRTLATFARGSDVSSATARGTTAWATDAVASQESWYIEGGSGDVRRLIMTDHDCELWSVATSDGATSPPLCNIQSLEWIDATRLIVSAGTESGAVLAEVSAPGTGRETSASRKIPLGRAAHPPA